MTTWTHNALVRDLAEHLRTSTDRMVWEDMQLGPAGSPRPDCYAVPKSYTRFTPLAYEIKISVTDYRRDVTAGKWQSYLRYAAGVTFAVPVGLVSKSDLPPTCGLMVRGPDGWKTLKAPTLAHVETLPRDAWLKLLIDGIARQHRDPTLRELDPWLAAREIRKRHGDRIGCLLQDLTHAESKLQADIDSVNATLERRRQAAQQNAERILQEALRESEQVSAAQALLTEIVGLPAGSSPFMIAGAVARLRSELAHDPLVADLKRRLRTVSEIASGDR